MKVLGVVENLIKDETDAKKRATVKGREIAKLGAQARQNVKFSGADFDIEILSMNAIEGGVEVFARARVGAGMSVVAYKNGAEPKVLDSGLVDGDDPNIAFIIHSGEQIGFGKDGSVDIERFRIFNPPILIPDGTQTLTEIRGVPVLLDNFKEDLAQAILQSIAHTIKVKQEKFGENKIVAGKIGNTTSTFYPSAGAASPCDGMVGRDGAYNDTFTDIRANTPTAANQASISDAYNWPCFLESTATFERYKACYRGIFNFDTSPIGSDTKNSAIFSLHDTARVTTLAAFTCHLNAMTPTTTDNVVVGDYLLSLAGTTSFGSIASGSISASAYNDITVNASGLTYINTAGVTSFGTRSDWDITNTAPTWAGSKAAYWQVKSSDAAGTSTDPKLVVEHTAAAASSRSPGGGTAHSGGGAFSF